MFNSNLTKFREAKHLFDIATCKCANLSVCIKVKIPVMGKKEFLNDQCCSRKMVIDKIQF